MIAYMEKNENCKENRFLSMDSLKKNSRFYLVAAFLAAAILALLCVGNGIWKEYRNSAVRNQKDQMLLAVESLSGRLEETISEYASDIRSMWSCSHTLNEQERETLWDTYVKEHGPVVQDVIIKKKGETILTSGTDNEPEETLSESKIDDQMCFRLVKIGNESHYLMLHYETDTGETISMILNGMAYYNKTIRPLNVGTNCYFLLKDHNGIVLMHPQLEQWGIDVINGREKMFPGKNLTSLSNMIDRQKQGLTAVDEYYSYWWTKPGAPGVEKVNAYTPAYIGDDFIIVSAVMDQSDMYVPLEKGALKLLFVFTGVLFTILAAASYIFHLMLKSRKDRQQISYLTELNGILERMHQSEETIAHQQRLQIMGTMTGGIAHEFNNLLTPIMGYAEFLMMDLPEGSDNYDSAKEIYDASVKAKEIIQQISSLSRKNMETAFKTLDADRVFKRALKMVRSVCPDNIELKENINLPGVTIVGNETQLNQVILNIGVNAIHAIDRSIKAKAITAYVYDHFLGDIQEDFAKREGLLFVGGFAHPPNADAVLWFAKEIFPHIREQLPDIKFYVVGSKVTDEIKALEQPGNGIIIKGFVSEEELANLYAFCKVVVVPLRYGAGVKGKVVEAIYNGAPIITTSTGAEGIPQVEQVLEVEDDPKTFADKTVALYQDNDRCRQMCEGTQKYIREHFSMDGAWKVIEEDFSR